MILVTSGAAIGRIDYMPPQRGQGFAETRGHQNRLLRTGAVNPDGNVPPVYSSEYSIRQVLVEHSHMNDPEKAEHIRHLLYRAANQNAIPIVNYNDAVSSEENRKFEIRTLMQNGTAGILWNAWTTTKPPP